MKLSVVIVTWNSAADIDTCIDSLNYLRDFEVIVVDNASGDDTLARLAAHHHLRVLANGSNVGYSRACNQGIAAATGEHILLLNPDTQVELGALDAMSGYLDRHPEVAAIAPRLVNWDGTRQLSVRSLPTVGSVLWEITGLPRLFPRSRIGRWRLRNFDYDRGQPVEQPMASCLMFRREVLIRLGGFDESFPLYYNDVDLSRRMDDAGLTTWYLPEARVFHRIGASTGQVRPQAIRAAHRSLFRYLRRQDRSGWFWLKSVFLLPSLELSGLIRATLARLRRR